MPPRTRYQERNPHGLVFSGKPISGNESEQALLPGIWVYLEVPSRCAHLYALMPDDYLMNYAETFPDNTLASDLLPEVIEHIRAYFAQKDTTLSAIDTTQMTTPGAGQVFAQ